ncbi:MAG: hypothetical protein ACK5PS_10945 [Desulfopila sp.]
MPAPTLILEDLTLAGPAIKGQVAALALLPGPTRADLHLELAHSRFTIVSPTGHFVGQGVSLQADLRRNGLAEATVELRGHWPGWALVSGAMTSRYSSLSSICRENSPMKP